MESKDYYKIMGVARDATQDEIKRAYRKLARKYHPDVSKAADADACFKEVGEAYEVLKDPEKRKAFDQLGSDWQNSQNFQSPPDWNEGFGFHDGSFTHAEREQFRNFQMRGEDTYAKVMIDLEDAYRGATRTLTLSHVVLGADNRPELTQRTLKVQIPKGVRQGQHIRLSKQGGAGIGSGQPGDLYLEIEFHPHALYHVEGRDVYLDLPVTPWEAALGASITAPTPTGSVKLKIPANSTNGSKLRLKARGIPGNPSGDLYVVIQATLPPATTDAARQAYRDFEKATAFNPRHHLGV